MGRQVLTGISPLVIARCTSLPEHFNVTNDDVVHMLNGKTLEEEMEVTVINEAFHYHSLFSYSLQIRHKIIVLLRPVARNRSMEGHFTTHSRRGSRIFSRGRGSNFSNTITLLKIWAKPPHHKLPFLSKQKQPL